MYGGYSTGDVGKLNLNFNYNLTEVRKQDQRWEPTCTVPNGILASRAITSSMTTAAWTLGLPSLKEQYQSLTYGNTAAGNMREWYDNNRTDAHVKYYGLTGKTTTSSRPITTGWEKNPGSAAPAPGRTLTMPSTKPP